VAAREAALDQVVDVGVPARFLGRLACLRQHEPRLEAFERA
jgi:hypothetical protein